MVVDRVPRTDHALRYRVAEDHIARPRNRRFLLWQENFTQRVPFAQGWGEETSSDSEKHVTDGYNRYCRRFAKVANALQVLIGAGERNRNDRPVLWKKRVDVFDGMLRRYRQGTDRKTRIRR
jgi:hypothetical protein